jgi:hypothetical protein
MKTIKENIQSILAIMIVALSFIYFFTILFVDQKSEPQVIIAIVAMVGAATGYYFGSSQSIPKQNENQK